MSKRLRSVVAKKLGKLWRRTLTSGHLLKRALSPKGSPLPKTFPAIKHHEDSSQSTIFLVFDPGEQRNGEGATDRAEPKANFSAHRLPIRHGPNGGFHPDMSPQFELFTDPPKQASNLSDDQVDSGVEEGFQQSTNEATTDKGSSEDTSDTHCEAPEILDGPVQLVVANFNDKNHLAMLVTKDMIERLNDISRESREVGRLGAQVEIVNREVSLAAIEVRYCEDSIEEAQSEEAPEEQIDELRKELASLQKTLDERKARRDPLESELAIYNRNIRYSEGLFQDLIQDKLNEAGLLETAQKGPDSRSTDHNSIRPETLNDVDGNGNADNEVQQELRSYEVQSDHSDVSSHELARRAAYQECAQRTAELRDIEEEFDNRHEAYELERARLKQRISAGDHSRSLTEFDQSAFKTDQQLTREFAAAEEAFEEALARRRQFGYNNDGRESGFLDDEYDGYPLSWEDDAIHSAPLTKIYNWLEGLPDIEIMPEVLALHQGARSEFGQNESGNLDDCDVRSAGMSNAWSTYDLTRNRRRIDCWRRMAGRTR
ncbi:MAG: hypothetical protein Q9174_003722 [Haloplaca sp. 1 TL-2023]